MSIENRSTYPFYLSRQRPVAVRFAETAGSIETLEGGVLYQTGAAIVTGVHGEQYPITRKKFDTKYSPVGNTREGADGQYAKRITTVRAVQKSTAFEVVLPDNRGVLAGNPGDWLVEYEVGVSAIVAEDIFSELYQPATVPVYFSAAEGVKPSVLEKLRDGLRAVMPDTIVEYCELNEKKQVWFNISLLPEDINAIAPTFQYHVGDVEQSLTALVNGVKNYLANETVAEFTWRKLSSLFSEKNNDAGILEWQLASVQRLNARIRHGKIGKIDDPSKPFADQSLQFIRNVAASVARETQNSWQILVMAKTDEITAQTGSSFKSNFFQLLLRPNLNFFGILAAVTFAAFTELSAGCNDHDWMAFLQCSTEAWHAYAGQLFFLVYLAELAVAWYLYARAKVARCEATHHDLRLLAELLRIQLVWSRTGIVDCVVECLPNVSHSQSGWVRSGLRLLHEMLLDQHAKSSQLATDPIKAQEERWKEVDSAFFKGQLDYYEDKFELREVAINRVAPWARRGLFIFIAGVITLFVNNVLEFSMEHGWITKQLQQGFLVVYFSIFIGCATLQIRGLTARLGGLLIFGSAFGGLMAAIFYQAALARAEIISPMVHHFIVIFCLGGLVFWGSIRRTMENFGWEAEYQRGVVLRVELKQARDEILQLRDQQAKIDVLRKIGAVYVNDQAAWHKVHRDNKIEAVSGG